MKKFLAVLGISTMIVTAGLITTTSYDQSSNNTESAAIYTTFDHAAHPTID